MRAWHLLLGCATAALVAACACTAAGCRAMGEEDPTARVTPARAEPPPAVVSPPASAAEEPPWKREIQKKLEGKYGYRWVDKTLPRALGSLQAAARVPIVVHKDTYAWWSGIKITLDAGKLTKAETLRRVAAAAHAEYDIIDGAIFIGEPRRIAEVARLAAAQNAHRTRSPMPPWEKELRGKLDESRSVGTSGSSLGKALVFAEYMSKRSLFALLDPDIPDVDDLEREPIYVNGRMSVEKLFAWIGRAAGLDCELRDGYVLFSTPELIEAARRRRARARGRAPAE